MAPIQAKPFHRPGWVYEEKYDGWRMIAYKDGRVVRLVSRNAVDHTERFRELAAAIAALKAPTLILDGEVCVFDKQLISQFHLLGNSESGEPCTPPVFMAFDCLHVHGGDVRGLPLHRRRHMLEEEIADARMIYAARRLPNNGHAAWAVVKERGYEGLVANDEQLLCRGGPTRSWIKCKIRLEGRSCSAASSACRPRSRASSSRSALGGSCSSEAPSNGVSVCGRPKSFCGADASAVHRRSMISASLAASRGSSHAERRGDLQRDHGGTAARPDLSRTRVTRVA